MTHDPAGEAEELIAEFVLRQERGEEPDFDALRAAHPELAPELERLHRMLCEVRRILGPESITVARTEGDRTEDRTPLLQRLADHAPAGSRYRLEGEIGRGGMGVILKAFDPDLRRHLALKVIRDKTETPGGEAEMHSLDRFLEEAQVTGQLEHPGVVPVHELGLDEEGRAYFTMRLVRGRNLAEIFGQVAREADGWTVTRALGVLLRACEAVAFAHSKGVVHRDLKPQNIMVGRFGETYVMDWGLARVLGRDEIEEPVRTDRRAAAESGAPLATLAGSTVGTPAYMPPEQAAGHLDEVGLRSDVYAMGAILYHLLAGHPPYAHEGGAVTPQQILDRVVGGPPEPLDSGRRDLPAELEAICQRAMARNADDRYPSMEHLADDLRAYLEQRVVSAYASGPVAELRKWITRNRSLALTAAAAVLAIGIVVAWAFTNVREERAAAEQNERQAREEKRRVLQVSDVKRLNDLLDREEVLWPALPHRLADMEDWLDQARALVQRRAMHESTLAGLRQRGTRIDAARFDFGSDTENQWWHDTLAGLIAGLDGLVADDPYATTVRSVTDRYRLASSIRLRSIDAFQREWDDARASIADRDDCPAYDGLELEEIVGLVPLGRDPESDLWEFWHVPSGTRPERDAQGILHPDDASGIVLVLLPGDRFTMGSQSADPAGPNFDPASLPDEADSGGRPRSVSLDPFFLSKYELTQGQWQRIMGENPAGYGPGKEWAGQPFTLSNPVEQVSWHDCRRLLDRLGLEFPTEAQWEFANRAGTDSPWWTGDDPTVLENAANVADRTLVSDTRLQQLPFEEHLEDGFAGHAPVGEFLANPFGLHDTIGNVWEWCADAYLPYDVPARDGDGLRPGGEGLDRVIRGGGYFELAIYARSALRNRSAPEIGGNAIGLRPAMPAGPGR